MSQVIPMLTLLLACYVSTMLRAAEPWTAEAATPRTKTVLVIHGGAGVLTPDEMKGARQKQEEYEAAMKQALSAGYRALKQEGKTGVDAVEAAIRVMEDSDLFNAGRGAALNHDGQAELDAAIMEGTAEGRGEGKADPRKRAGAVAGLTHVKNPISAARAIMEMPGSRHALLVGEGAERFLLREENRRRYHLEEVSNVYFWTERRLRQVREAVKDETRDAARGAVSDRELDWHDDGPAVDRRMGTVGAVALHGRGSLVAGTSTGGLTNKLVGRVGDTPLIGAGTYADDRACGVSCTGTGEVFIRHAAAHDVVARMLYGKLPVDEAARKSIDEMPDEDGGVGGLIALDKDGRHSFAMSARSIGMYRGYVTEDGEIFVGIYREEGEKSMGKVEPAPAAKP